MPETNGTAPASAPEGKPLLLEMCWTSAPIAYDGGLTYELGNPAIPVTTEVDGVTYRCVGIVVGNVEWQAARYKSGMFAFYHEWEWRKYINGE